MKRMESRFAFISFLVVAACVAGCRDQSNSGGASSMPAALQTSGPEESFELIVQTFRRGIEDVPIGFVVRREGGHSMLSGKNEVSHELIRPAKEGDPYKAFITVERQSQYSIKQSPATDREAEAEEQDSEFSGLDDSGGEGDTEILDSDLVASSGTGRHNRRPLPGAADEFVDRRAEKASRTYELLYENGRWKLVTTLDPETEQSIENAFDQALKTQI